MGRMTQELARAALKAYPFHCGQGRLVDRTPLRAMRFKQGVMTVPCVDGFQIEVMPNDHIGRHLFLTGQFDRTIVEVLLSFCTGGDERILDIGANVGYVSCAMLHALPRGRVVSVEPQPRVYELLARNVAAVGSGRGKAINSAVSDVAGLGMMSVREGNTGASRIVSGGSQVPAGSALEVRVIDGAGLLEASGLDRVDAIKIDVEGHEETVFWAIAPLLSRHAPRAIVFEHGGDLADASRPIRRVLDPLGYELYGIRKGLFGWTLRPLRELAAKGERASDYVARRAGGAAAPVAS